MQCFKFCQLELVGGCRFVYGIVLFAEYSYFCCVAQEGKEPQYKDEIDCFKQLVAKEGPASLYSGLVPQLLGIAPEKVSYFSGLSVNAPTN